MEDELAEKIQLKITEEDGIDNGAIAVPDVPAAEETGLDDSQSAGVPAKTIPIKPIPWRLPRLLIGIMTFGLLLVSWGICMRFVWEPPPDSMQQGLLQEHDGTFIQLRPSTKVVIAKEDIAQGELFSDKNTELVPMGDRATTRFPVTNRGNLFGNSCMSNIRAGTVIDARKVGPLRF